MSGRLAWIVLLIVCFVSATVRAAPASDPAAAPDGGSAPAADGGSAPAADSAPTPAPTTPAPAPATGGDLNFNLLDENKPKLTAFEEAAKARRDAEIARKVTLRRKLLVVHQGFGFATLGLLALTLVFGTLNYVDKYGGGDDNGEWYWWHTSFAGIATTAFATTGILALVAPNPYPKPRRFDTAMLHKIMMGIATAGFVAESILGPIVAWREGKLDQRDWALAHLVIGYGTFASMGVGTLAFVFK